MCLIDCVGTANKTLRAIVKSSNVPFGGSFFYSVVILGSAAYILQRIEKSDYLYDTKIFSTFS